MAKPDESTKPEAQPAEPEARSNAPIEPGDVKVMSDETNPRRSGISEIAKKAREQRNQAISESQQQIVHDVDAGSRDLTPLHEQEPEKTDEPEKAQEKTPSSPEAEPPAVTEPGEPAPARSAAPDEPMVRVNIGGELKEVPASAIRAKLPGQDGREISGEDLLRGHQMYDMGSARLREANRLQQRPAQPQQPQSEAPGEPAPPAQPQDREDFPVTREEMSEAVKQIQYGDDDAAVNAFETLLRKVSQRHEAPSLDQNAIIDSVRQQVEQQVYLEQERRTFEKDFSDILDSPQLLAVHSSHVTGLQRHQLAELGYEPDRLAATHPQVVSQIYAAEQAKGVVRPVPMLHRQAGELTRSWAKNLAASASNTPAQEQQPSGNDVTRLEERRNQKRAASSPPVSASARKPGDPQPERKTPQQVVMSMRRARGQHAAA